MGGTKRNGHRSDTVAGLGANVDFRKYFEKYAWLTREQKFPEIYLTRDRILLFVSRVPNSNAGGAPKIAVFCLQKATSAVKMT